jgi:hypothetical protein
MRQAAPRTTRRTSDRDPTQEISPPVRSTTITVLISGHCPSAASALRFSGTFRPPRSPSSAVMRSFAPQSLMRLARLSGENPANTTEWTAPMRAQASIA